MTGVLGVINLTNEQDELKELTVHRSIASVPFGGRYRLIDFALSNMVNAGIHNVAVFTRNKQRSLLDHLGSGKEWDLDRQRGGLFILPPNEPQKEYKGDLQHFSENSTYFKRSTSDYVLITCGHLIWNINYNHLLSYHSTQDADVTFVYKDFEKDVDFGGNRKYCKLEMDDAGRVYRIVTEERAYPGDNQFLETYFIKKSLLMELIAESIDGGGTDLLRDVMMSNLDRLNIQGYHFKGYAAPVRSIESFYHYSMDLLDPNISQELFFNKGPIYTKVKHEPPAKYKESSRVSNSLIANGCLIEGTVENSILFRGVKVAKDAVIRNSIIMQKGEIGAGVHLENVILDKDVKILSNKTIIGADESKVIAKSSSIH
jgi:glucose-1-phosphate adenylyltransferase